MDRKLWESLQRFESRDYLARDYNKKHGRSLNAHRSHEIGSCFAQGREYFASASTSSDTVKPLLLYYGVASLARGATLLKSREKREESLTPGHGLVTVEWPKVLHDGIANVLNLAVQATKGTFSEFVGAIGNCQTYSWRQQDNCNGFFRNDFGEVKYLRDSSTITLGDLLSREKDLAAEYEIANDGWGNTDFGRVVALDNALRVIFMPTSHVDVASAIQSYGFPANATVSLKPMANNLPIQTIVVDITASGEDRKKVAPLAFDQDKEVGWLVRPFSNHDNMIDIHRMYIEAFIVGMLSRYFPSKWMSLLRSEKGDIARSVILAAVARIEAKFPQLICDQLH